MHSLVQVRGCLRCCLPYVHRRAWSCKGLLCFMTSIYLVYFFSPTISTPKYENLPFAADLTGSSFLMHGKPVQIMSGAIHYFRVLPQLWEDRLRTMQAAGLNAIETYVEWSSHEPEEGLFDFEGQQDIVRFLRIAHRLGFMVILRPGPYICAERDFGGLPYWLLRNGTSIRLRTMDQKYIFYADRYLTKVYEKVRPLLISNGGPIIMVQVENEYGSYSACDSAYMVHLRDLAWAQLGREVTLFTTDNGGDMLKCGAVQGTLATLDFGTSMDPGHALSRRRHHQSAGPLINSEMYTGWLDYWGEQHHVVNASLLALRIRAVLAMKASFNLYMFHGGTNFGFKTGANMEQGFRPQPTSYDYDAPIDESGDATPKLKAIRDVIAEFFPDRVKMPIPAPKEKMALGKLVLKRMFGLKEMRHLMRSLAVKSTYPLTFEQVGHGYGFMLYETRLTFQPTAASVLKIHGIRDRGYVYLDDTLTGIVSRTDGGFEVIIEAKAKQIISIVVENQGRINYGSLIADPKGIVENVTLDDLTLTDWKMVPIDLSNGDWLRDAGALEEIRRQGANPAPIHSDGLAVYATTFALSGRQTARDSFLRLSYWIKGVAFLNGFNLGRYWTPAGPQKTLYVPGVLFKQNDNILIVMELEATRSASPGYCSVDFVAEPNINSSVRWPL